MNIWWILAIWAAVLLVIYLFMAIEVAWYDARVHRFLNHLRQLFLEDED